MTASVNASFAAPLEFTVSALLLPLALGAVVVRRPGGSAGWVCLSIVAARTLAILFIAFDSKELPRLIASVDVAICTALVWTAVRSHRHFPLILAAISLIAVVAHGLALAGLIASAAALDALLAATSCGMLLTVIVGVLRRDSEPDPIADNFPAGSACPGPLNR